MRIATYAALILILPLLLSCSTSVNVIKTAEFNPNSSITIVPDNQDPLAIKSKLEHRFLTHGFDVVSEATAQEKIKYQQNISSDSEGISNTAEVGAVQEIGSVYALTFQYTSRMDVPAGYVFGSFSASVVRMNDGRLVASTDFSQGQMTGKRISKVLDSFVGQLVD